MIRPQDIQRSEDDQGDASLGRAVVGAKLIQPPLTAYLDMKTKDIPDEPIMIFLAKQSSPSGLHDPSRHNHMPTIRDASPLMRDLPEKLILSKMNNMIRRGLITGCTCGCRGDFELVD